MGRLGSGCLVLAGALALVVVVVAGAGVARYNALVTLDEGVDAAWSQVENVLQRRADLVPNLVETVKGYAAHEEEVFTRVAEARARLAGAATPEAAAAADAGLTSALGRLLAIAESYPDLKANQSFVRLQDELAGTENRIAVERMRYNDAVRALNTAVQRFPDTLLASWLGFEQREYFTAEEGAQEAPEVRFSD